MVVAISRTLVVDLSKQVDAFGCIPQAARMAVGRVLGDAPAGARMRVELGTATLVDDAVIRVLLDYVPRHDIEVCGAETRTVARLVRQLRGEADEFGDAA